MQQNELWTNTTTSRNHHNRKKRAKRQVRRRRIHRLLHPNHKQLAIRSSKWKGDNQQDVPKGRAIHAHEMDNKEPNQNLGYDISCDTRNYLMNNFIKKAVKRYPIPNVKQHNNANVVHFVCLWKTRLSIHSGLLGLILNIQTLREICVIWCYCQCTFCSASQIS